MTQQQALALERRMASLRNALNPLLPLLEDDHVIEIMLNTDGRIWVDAVGTGMYCSDIHMPPDTAERIIRLVAAAMGTEAHDQKPSLSGKLPGWGARIQATLPPVVTAPTFALRKPSPIVFTLKDYVNQGIMTLQQSQIITQAILNRKNILVGGGTGSGKTTLTNALLDVIATTHHRVYLVEDTVELQCQADNKLQLLVQPPTYTWQRAIMDAMRYRPDRIIVGEVRDGIAALEMLKAWNTGHPGGIATIHADSPIEMLDRMGELIGEEKAQPPYKLIARAIDLCIHMTRDESHKAGRQLSGIIQVMGVDGQGGWEVMGVG